MAMFKAVLPDELMKGIERYYHGVDEMLGEMTQAGAEVVEANVKMNMPASFHKSKIKNNLYVTQAYYAPSDGSINTKIGFYGYFINHRGKRTPAPLVANMFEYGRSNFLKRPFFRKSFNEQQIFRAMKKQQEIFFKRTSIKDLWSEAYGDDR